MPDVCFCFCFFLPADEKEEGILGSILLPSFHISMLSVDDHINRKYAFKVSACFHSCEALLDSTIHGCILFDHKKP